MTSAAAPGFSRTRSVRKRKAGQVQHRADAEPDDQGEGPDAQRQPCGASAHPGEVDLVPREEHQHRQAEVRQ